MVFITHPPLAFPYDYRFHVKNITYLPDSLRVMADPQGKVMRGAFSYPFLKKCPDVGLKESPGIGIARRRNGAVH